MSLTFILIFSVLTFIVAFVFCSLTDDIDAEYIYELKRVLLISTGIVVIADCILIATHFLDWLL